MPRDTDWFAISSSDWKVHVVPAVFADALIAEMHVRGFKGAISRRPITNYGLDRGGMARLTRPVEEFAFCGLDFGLPSEHVRHFCERLAELSPRVFADGERSYYKLHCHWNCIILTAAQRQALLRALRSRIGKAEARATAFYQTARS